MEAGIFGGAALLVFAAFAFKLLGFLARDELLLRLLILTGTLLNIVYFFIVADRPLWEAILTNGLLASANILMIGIVLSERVTWSMTPDILRLYRMFPLMSPREFRKLLKAATLEDIKERRVLVRQGEHPDRLFFIVEGTVAIHKNNEVVHAGPKLFIGEIAFLTGDPASATVAMEGSGSVMVWNATKLEKLLEKTPNLKAALVGHLNMDLAQKVAASQPVQQSKTV